MPDGTILEGFDGEDYQLLPLLMKTFAMAGGLGMDDLQRILLQYLSRILSHMPVDTLTYDAMGNVFVCLCWVYMRLPPASTDDKLEPGRILKDLLARYCALMMTTAVGRYNVMDVWVKGFLPGLPADMLPFMEAAEDVDVREMRDESVGL